MRIIGFFVGAALVSVLIAFWSVLFPNANFRSEKWLKSVLLAQDSLAQQRSDADTSRLLIVSGSNGLFGFDGAIIEEYTDHMFASLASHASFSIDFHTVRLNRLAEPGDLVIIPLELELYHRTAPTTWEQRQNLAWLHAEYKVHNPIERLIQNWSTPTELLLNTAVSSAFPDPSEQQGDEDEFLARARDRAAFEPVADKTPFYTVAWLNRWGIISAPFRPRGGAVRHVEQRGSYQYFNDKSDLSFAMGEIQSLLKTIEMRGGKGYVTLPALMSTPNEIATGQFERNKQSLQILKSKLDEAGIPYICDDSDAFFPPSAFLDTKYHLNAIGASVRSVRLLECLSEHGLLADSVSIESGVAFDAALSARSRLGNQAYLFDRRFQDFQRIEAALQEYKRTNGQFPISVGWDGVSSRYGRSAEDWIRGLAPSYIDALPRDPRATDLARDQYLYRSDGTDYKLIAHSQEDCDLFDSFNSAYIDPRRTNAWGVWTPGAHDW